MDGKKSCDEIKEFSMIQKEFIQSMSEIMEKLDVSQLMVEGNAFDAINSTDTTLNLVKEGIGTIDTLIDKITVMNESIDRAYVKMEQLFQLSSLVSEISKKIGGISNRIGGVSRNALIGAAKEDVQKDSIKNLAEEMKQLSEEASFCSNEMDETVQAIQMFVGDATKTVSGINEMALEENAMISDVKVVLQKILEASRVANDVSRNMEHEIAYQRDITDNVVKAIDGITRRSLEFELNLKPDSNSL